MSTLQLPGLALIATVSDFPDGADNTTYIQTFYAVPNPIGHGARVILFWGVLNAANVRVTAPGYDSGVMTNTGSGYLVLDPGPTTTKVYTLTALDDSGNPIVQNGSHVTSAVTVTVL